MIDNMEHIDWETPLMIDFDERPEQLNVVFSQNYLQYLRKSIKLSDWVNALIAEPINVLPGHFLTSAKRGKSSGNNPSATGGLRR